MESRVAAQRGPFNSGCGESLRAAPLLDQQNANKRSGSNESLEIHDGANRFPKRRRIDPICDEAVTGQQSSEEGHKLSCPTITKGQATHREETDLPEATTDTPFQSAPVPETRPQAKKRLQPVPTNAPRNIVMKGKYMFHKGVRIRDFRIPAAQSEYQPPNTHLQYRDGFDSNEASTGIPQRIRQTRQLCNTDRSTLI